MEALIVALIGATGALLAAIISGIYSNRKINKELALHDQKSSSESQSLAKEHTMLSQEHTALSKELAAGSERIVQNLSSISGDIRIVRERQAEDRVRQEMAFKSLDEKQKHLMECASDMGKFAQEFSRIAIENEQLRMENRRLQQQQIQLKETIKHLEQQVYRSQHPSIQDMDYGMGFEP